MLNVQFDRSLIAKLKPEGFPEPYNIMAEIIGVEKTLELSIEFGGQQIYFPAHVNIIKDLRNESVRNDYMNGNHSIRELAKKYGVSDTWVRQIIKGGMKKKESASCQRGG